MMASWAKFFSVCFSIGLACGQPSEVPYYGRSPPVYPSLGDGKNDPAWASAYVKAEALVAQMTMEEKSNITRGFEGQCVGNTGEVPRLNIPALCFADAPDGVRGQEFVTAFPAGIHVAATFDRNLMHQYGYALGNEYRGKGINVALGPVAGPLGRIARGGRNWEGLSADPYLAGAGMGAITRGIQDAGVMSVPKHFLLNEQEFRRRESDLGEAISSNLDDRTLHELYAFPFMDALHEGAASVMCSYQRANHSYGCQNSKLLNGVLKTTFGFQGFVLSDWGAQHSGVASANAGLDVVMPDGAYWGTNLTDAVINGSVSTSRLDDMVTRVLASWYKLGQANGQFPPVGVYSNTQKHMPVEVQDASHAQLVREIGSAGTVLVKNVNNTLPLKNPKFLALYGYDATVKAAPWQNPSRFGGGYEVNFGWNTLNGTMITGGGSGTSTPSYVIDPFQAISARIARDRGTLRWDFESENPYPPYVNAEACLVFVNAYASESFDRVSLTDEFSDNLIRNVAANCSNTIPIIHSAGIRTVDPWIMHPNITAVLFAGLPGQETGNSLVDILYGDISPSGKLPYTVPKNESDYGTILNSTVSFDYFPNDDFTEGLYIDYRHFDKESIEPRFEFGFGLSYSTFEFEGLHVTLLKKEIAEYPNPATPILQGGHPELWDMVLLVNCTVSNTGEVAASEIAQLYLGIPHSPVRQLRGFERVHVKPGDKQEVEFGLSRRDLSIWDIEAQEWRVQRGVYKVWVGASSRDLSLDGEFEI